MSTKFASFFPNGFSYNGGKKRGPINELKLLRNVIKNGYSHTGWIQTCYYKKKNKQKYFSNNIEESNLPKSS